MSIFTVMSVGLELHSYVKCLAAIPLAPHLPEVDSATVVPYLTWTLVHAQCVGLEGFEGNPKTDSMGHKEFGIEVH
jgi:hypothetical protein